MSKRFVNLWESGSTHLSLPQVNIDDIFPTMFGSLSPLHLWHPREGIGDYKIRLLLVVSTYAFNDMYILDRAEEYISERELNKIRVDVINRIDISSDAELDRCFPNQPLRLMTPIAGLWIDGQLVDTAFGTATFPLVMRALKSAAGEGSQGE